MKSTRSNTRRDWMIPCFSSLSAGLFPVDKIRVRSMNTIIPAGQTAVSTGKPRSAAQVRYQQLCRLLDLSDVKNFLLREGTFKSDAEASDAIHAILQWLACHAVKQKNELFVMLHGPVDEAWHAFILNTKLYHAFCQEHVGFFIHHTPLDAQKANEFEILGGIKSTVQSLKESFGDELHPLLRHWEEQLDTGQLTISAVSCVKNGYDD